MVRRPSRRKFLRAAGLAFAVGTAGCAALRGRGRPRVESSLGTTAYDPVLDSQPSPDDGVPAAWGVLFSHPDAASKLIDWKALASPASTVEPGVEFRSFDPDEQFLSVVVGILPTGYGLTGYAPDPDSHLNAVLDDFRERPAFDDGTLRYEVTPYRAFSPDPGTPDNHYDYTFTLWNLNSHERPDELIVDFFEA